MLVLKQYKIGAASIVAAGACAHARAHAPSQTANELGPPPTTPPAALTQFSGLFGRQAAPKTCGYVSGVDRLLYRSILHPSHGMRAVRFSLSNRLGDGVLKLGQAFLLDPLICRRPMFRVHVVRLLHDGRNKTGLQYSAAQHNYHLGFYQHYVGASAKYGAAAGEPHARGRDYRRRSRRSRCRKQKMMMLTLADCSAALALLGGSMSFLLRRWRQKPPIPTAQPQPSLAFAPGAEFGSGPGHGYPGSIAKPEAADMTGSNSNAGLYASSPSSPTPAPVYSPGYIDRQVMPQPPFQAQQGWYPFPVQEVPTTRAERQVQELPGI
ncbi:hypothetical protein MANI_011703 [Metarhizium anisopliae]